MSLELTLITLDQIKAALQQTELNDCDIVTAGSLGTNVQITPSAIIRAINDVAEIRYYVHGCHISYRWTISGVLFSALDNVLNFDVVQSQFPHVAFIDETTQLVRG